MRSGIPTVVVLTNFLAIFCIVNPWFDHWIRHGFAFLVVEMIALVFIGMPVFMHHLRKGLSPRRALSASLDTVMHCVSSWV